MLQKNYGEAVQIIDDQKKELHMLVRKTEELRNRNSSVEDELKDVQQMLTDQ